jgi:hypothetical protein
VNNLSVINQALVDALGFRDLKGVNGLVLQLSPDKPPVVTVQRVIISDGDQVADKLKTVFDVYHLEPTK